MNQKLNTLDEIIKIYSDDKEQIYKIIQMHKNICVEMMLITAHYDENKHIGIFEYNIGDYYRDDNIGDFTWENENSVWIQIETYHNKISKYILELDKENKENQIIFDELVQAFKTSVLLFKHTLNSLSNGNKQNKHDQKIFLHDHTLLMFKYAKYISKNQFDFGSNFRIYNDLNSDIENIVDIVFQYRVPENYIQMCIGIVGNAFNTIPTNSIDKISDFQEIVCFLTIFMTNNNVEYFTNNNKFIEHHTNLIDQLENDDECTSLNDYNKYIFLKCLNEAVFNI
jgi:hypothetical protein